MYISIFSTPGCDVRVVDQAQHRPLCPMVRNLCPMDIPRDCRFRGESFLNHLRTDHGAETKPVSSMQVNS